MPDSVGETLAAADLGRAFSLRACGCPIRPGPQSWRTGSGMSGSAYTRRPTMPRTCSSSSTLRELIEQYHHATNSHFEEINHDQNTFEDHANHTSMDRSTSWKTRHLPVPHEQREDGVSRCHSTGGRGTARPGAASRGDASTAPTASRKQPAAKPQQQPVVTSEVRSLCMCFS
ncbi:hypothetical protein PVAP13_8KG318900 [Panicum virgatum]|uniref:Uncharacterized protein n=1 Tax=Panicum virgatum TaxID=38727 RepID=A0A8T0PQV6_PANVG|nr:hypothetical protein PVAP13_8KG318900 [Panicum virgatum]